MRQAANHLTCALLLLTQVTEGGTLDPAEADAQRQADTDHLGTDPVAAFRAATERSLAAFGKPGTMETEFPFLAGPVTGATLASIGMLEALVHGWDIARGARIDYRPDERIIETVWGFARHGVGDEQRRTGLFAEPLPVSPTAEPFVALLGHLGRRA